MFTTLLRRYSHVGTHLGTNNFFIFCFILKFIQCWSPCCVFSHINCEKQPSRANGEMQKKMQEDYLFSSAPGKTINKTMQNNK